jgi:hypothetical protein
MGFSQDFMSTGNYRENFIGMYTAT